MEDLTPPLAPVRPDPAVLATRPAPVVVVMGVQGCGKTTLGRRLAAEIGVEFVDGDDLHPAASRRRMAAGIPLTDADRAPWLTAVGRLLRERAEAGTGVVLACSALRRAYRDTLRGALAGAPRGLTFVHLHAEAAVLRERLATRSHDYMPPTLLDSQLATLEEPGPQETDVVAVDVTGPLAESLAAAVEAVVRER